MRGYAGDEGMGSEPAFWQWNGGRPKFPATDDPRPGWRWRVNSTNPADTGNQQNPIDWTDTFKMAYYKSKCACSEELLQK